jgi:hypothetical protein
MGDGRYAPRSMNVMPAIVGDSKGRAHNGDDEH